MADAIEPQGPMRSRHSTAARMERLVIVVALVGLACTGLPQKFSTESWAEFAIKLLGGIESARILHHFLAILMLAAMSYHILAVSYRWYVFGLRPRMFPGLGDLRDLGRQVLQDFGLRTPHEQPNPRFAYRLEYGVLFISAILLVMTGLILWNPIMATSVLPGEVVPAAHSIHSHQALLLVLFLVVWRLCLALLWRPHHDIVYDTEQSLLPAETTANRRRRFLPVAALVVIVGAVGMFWFLTSEHTAIDTVPRRQAVVFAPQLLPEAGNADVGAALWATLRCAFCHGEQATGGPNGEPALLDTSLTFDAFFQQVRTGSGDMPAFGATELPDGYLVHLWTWLTEVREQ